MFFTAVCVCVVILHCKTNKPNSLSCLHCFPFSFAPITYLFHSSSSTLFSFVSDRSSRCPHQIFLSYFTPSCYLFPLFSPFCHFFPLSLSSHSTCPFFTPAPFHLCPHHSTTLSSLPTSVFSICLYPPVSLHLFLCRVWEVTTGEVLNTLIHHNEAVLHLRFANGLMVTCSKDRSIAVWDMASPTDISLRRVLVGHRAAVNVVDFDDKYIVSASGDRTIKVTKSKSAIARETFLIVTAGYSFIKCYFSNKVWSRQAFFIFTQPAVVV